MNEHPTDLAILEALRSGSADAWKQVVAAYQNRLLHFARSRVSQSADAEDLVQDTFISFMRSIDQFRAEASLETYLYVILKNKIYSRYRNKRCKSTCLAEDVFNRDNDNGPDAFEQIPASDPSITWHITQKEQEALQHQALSEALHQLVDQFKKTLNFQSLKICELLFYSNLSNGNTARLLGLNDSIVAVTKHRVLKQLRRSVARHYKIPDDKSVISDSVLSETWESERLSCPKRSTLGSFLLEALDSPWFDYVDFHLTTLGCHFCRASFKDLQSQKSSENHTAFKDRILASTIGFFQNPTKPHIDR